MPRSRIRSVLVVLLVSASHLAGSSNLEAAIHQELTDEMIRTMMERRSFEIGDARPGADSAGDVPPVCAPGDSSDPTGSSRDSAQCADGGDAGAGSPQTAAELAEALLGSAGGAGSALGSALGSAGLGLTTSILGAASGAMSGAAEEGAFPGAAAEGAWERARSQVDAASGWAGALGAAGTTPEDSQILRDALTPQGGAEAAPSSNNAYDSAKALLDAYNAALSEVVPPPSEAESEPSRARPNRALPPERAERPDAADRPLPGSRDARAPQGVDDRVEASAPVARARGASRPATSPASAPRGEGAVAAPRPVGARAARSAVGEDSTDARSVRRETPRAEPPIREARAEASAPPTPAAVSERFAGVASFEEAVAAREGDWFVVLGSYRIRAGADPLPSTAVDGSTERSGSAAIAGVQQRLWDAGHVPMVVRSDAVPRFEGGFAVIVVGPLTRSQAEAQLVGLRRIVPDAYIKAGW